MSRSCINAFCTSYAELGHGHAVQKHNVVKIIAVLHGECESQRFLVEECTGLKSIVHFFSPDGLSCSRERWLRVT